MNGKSTTFKEEIHHPSFDHDNNLSLHSSSPDLSSYPSSSAATLSASSPPYSLAAQAIRYSTIRPDSTESHSNSVFWGVIARKDKAILEDDDASRPNHMPANTGMSAQQQPCYQAAAEPFRKMENPAVRKGFDAITSSLNQLGDTFEMAFEAADLKLMKRKGGNYEDSNQAPLGLKNSWHRPLPQASQQLNPTKHETQLKASPTWQWQQRPKLNYFFGS